MTKGPMTEAPMTETPVVTDISPDFVHNARDAAIARALLQWEATPRAVREFNHRCHELTDYSYWFLLSTLWVSYTGWSDLALWKRLFASERPNRATSIMKPSELAMMRDLPDPLSVARAQREGETDWISYTVDLATLRRFAQERRSAHVICGLVRKADVTALFTRRGEFEIIVLDKSKVFNVQTIPVFYSEVADK